jgi:hypothetical protein
VAADDQAVSSPAGRQRAALLSSLNSQREHILGILDGLSEEDLRRPVLPSEWTCLGLVQHLAGDVEEFWFRHVVGEPAGDDGDEADAWQVSPEVPAETVFSDYRQQIERADAIIAATPWDAPAWWPDFFGDFGWTTCTRSSCM